jgi:hypothetical protein
MPQYTAPTYSGGSVVNPSDLAGELTNVASAYNSLDSTNFPTGSRYIPNAAIDKPNAIFTATLRREVTLAGAVAVGTAYDHYIVPCSCTLARATVICTAISTGGDVGLYNYGGSAVTAAKTISAANTAYVMTLSDTSFSQGDDISLEFTIGGGNSLTGVVVNLTFYANHMLTTLPS